MTTVVVDLNWQPRRQHSMKMAASAVGDNTFLVNLSQRLWIITNGWKIPIQRKLRRTLKPRMPSACPT